MKKIIFASIMMLIGCSKQQDGRPPVNNGGSDFHIWHVHYYCGADDGETWADCQTAEGCNNDLLEFCYYYYGAPGDTFYVGKVVDVDKTLWPLQTCYSVLHKKYIFQEQ